MAYINPDTTGLLYDENDWRRSFSVLIDHFNGQIDDSNIKAAANISTAKLNAPAINGVLVGATTLTGAVAQVAPGTSGNLLTSNGTIWQSSTPAVVAQQMVLLKANSGTTSNAAANDMDTVDITGLTAKDTLDIRWRVYMNGATSITGQIYQSTSAKNLYGWFSGATLTNGQTGIGHTIICQDPFLNTVYETITQDGKATSGGGATGVNELGGATGCTAWTGSWTLGFHSLGVVGGGSASWAWSVYKIAGQ